MGLSNPEELSKLPWDDYVNSNPLEDIRAAVREIREGSVYAPNAHVITQEQAERWVREVFAQHSDHVHVAWESVEPEEKCSPTCLCRYAPKEK